MAHLKDNTNKRFWGKRERKSAWNSGVCYKVRCYKERMLQRTVFI